MADDLTDEEKALLAEHRAKNRKPRKVTVHGEHEGSKYSFDLEGDEADAVIARHKDLFTPAAADDDGKDDKTGGARRSYLSPASKPKAS